MNTIVRINDFPPEVQEKLESLRDEVNKWCESVEEYLESEDSSLADYCSTFGYGCEGFHAVDFRLCDEETTRGLKILKSLTPEKRFAEKMVEVCSLEFTHGCHCRTNEVFSCVLGESEEQIPDELWDKIKTLDPKEFEWLQRYVETCIPDRCYKNQQTDRYACAYFARDYDRWSMIVDSEKLEQAIDEALESVELGGLK